MELLNILWQIFITCLETVLSIYLLKQRLGLGKTWKVIVGSIFLTSTILFFNFTGLSDTQINLARLVVGVITVLFSFWAFKKSYTMRFIWGAMVVGATTVAETTTFGIVTLFNNYDLSSVMQLSLIRIQITIMYILIYALFVFCLANIKRKSDNNFFLSKQAIPFIIGIFFATIFSTDKLVNVMLFANMHDKFAPIKYDILFICITFLAIFIALIFALWRLGIASQKNLEYQLNQQKESMEKENYLSIEKAIEILRIEQHDTQDRLQAMQLLLDNNRIDDLRKFLEDQCIAYCKKAITAYTPNAMLNALLTTKSALAQDVGIRMDINIHFDQPFPLSDTDLCSVSGNLLNNAIEACKTVSEEKRYVMFEINVVRGMFALKVTNSSCGEYIFVNGNIKTTKKSGRHGIGLKGVGHIAEENNGFLNIQPNENSFSTIVMIPLNE